MVWAFRSGGKRRVRVLAVHEGQKRTSGRLCFFACYDRESAISPFLRAYIAELRRCHFDIVLCCTSENLDESALAELLTQCHQVIHRENRGHDFYSWKTCFDLTPNWSQADVLLLTNDSILGPLSSLEPVIAKLSTSKAELTGLNDSWERGYHLQSFFLLIKPAVLRARFFRRFWRGLKVIDNKNELVKRYEVGLSAATSKAGFQLEAAFPVGRVAAHCADLGDAFQYREALERRGLNAPLLCWYELVTYFNYPFVKAAVVKNNRYNSKHIGELRRILSRVEEEGVDEYLEKLLPPL